MTKIKIIEKLTELGISFDPTAKVAELEALLPVEPESDEVLATTATVSWRGNTRVYSQVVHGDDFATLAREYAKKVQGDILLA